VPIGPVEYLIVGFPGNKFKGEIAPALGELVDNGLVRILDLVFITKDEAGDVAFLEYDAVDELAVFGEIDGESGGLVSSEDIEYAAASLPLNSSAAVLVWENVWATKFAEALRDADGFVVEGARIPHDLIEVALSELTPVS
jgi:Family of unknown function (DUF6325)